MPHDPKNEGCKRKPPKLNEGLCVNSFDICVPKLSDFDGLGPVKDGKDSEKRWRCYLQSLRQDLPPGGLDSECECEGEEDGCARSAVASSQGSGSQESGASKQSVAGAEDDPAGQCYPPGGLCGGSIADGCRGGWKLTGDLAVAHARRVHARLHRQFLRFLHVSAVDVGFAVLEERNCFENRLALRVHVTPKRAGYLLRESSIPSFTNLCYLCSDPQGEEVESRCTEIQGGEPEICSSGDKKEEEPTGPVSQTRSCLPKTACRCDCENGCKDLETCLCQKCRREQREDDSYQYERYPIAGIRRADLSAHCYRKQKAAESLLEGTQAACAGWRLCLFGVPIDIVDARYFPSQRPVDGGSFDRGVFTDRLQRGDELSREETLLTGRSRIEPLVGGVSVGSVLGQAGTLGAVVWDRTDGSPCILSNWHVLAGTAGATIGQPTYQPALFDGGTEVDVVAHLKRWHLGDLGDAAIAELNGEREYAADEILGMWYPISGYICPALGMEIRKWGRSSGFTKGFIDGIDLATNIDYGGGVIRYFKHQFHIAPLFRGQDVSQAGDSGALVLKSFKPRKLRSEARRHQRESRRHQNLLHRCLEDTSFLAEIRRELKKGKSEEAADIVTVLENVAAAHDGKGRGPKPSNEKECLDLECLKGLLTELGADLDCWEKNKESQEQHEPLRVYYAVGLIFAGDTPGSPFGEFALASDISLLAEQMQFSLRPVFEPRSSFRKLRSFERGGQGSDRPRGRRALQPGAERGDTRPGGPQPDPEPANSGPG